MNRNARTDWRSAWWRCWSPGWSCCCAPPTPVNRTNVVGYFANSNGFYVGDDVRILGVTVGKIDTIEPQPERVKVSFWYDSKYKVPADAKRCGPVAHAGHLARHPADAGIHRRAGDGGRRGDPAGAHRCSGGVGRPSASSWRGWPRRCSRPSRAVSARWARSSTPPPTISAARVPTSATPSSNCRKPFRPSATTAPTSSPPSRTCRSWCRRCRTAPTLMRQLNQNLASVTASAGQRPQRGRPTPSAISTLRSGTCKASWPTTGNHSARRPTSWPRSPRRWPTASTTSSRPCTWRPTHSRTSSTSISRLRARLSGVLADQQLRQSDHLPLRRGAGRVAVGRRAVGEALRAISGADHQEPPVQLPADRVSELLRRCHGAAERDHLQRGLDAARLRPAAAATGRTGPGWRASQPAPTGPPLAGRGSAGGHQPRRRTAPA